VDWEKPLKIQKHGRREDQKSSSLYISGGVGQKKKKRLGGIWLGGEFDSALRHCYFTQKYERARCGSLTKTTEKNGFYQCRTEKLPAHGLTRLSHSTAW